MVGGGVFDCRQQLAYTSVQTQKCIRIQTGIHHSVPLLTNLEQQHTLHRCWSHQEALLQPSSTFAWGWKGWWGCNLQ